MQWWKAKKTKGRRRAWAAPVILPRVINEYLNRKRDSFLWVKKASREELLSEVGEFEFHGHAPMLHQLACYVLGVELPEFLFFLDMGAGKSRIILDIFRKRREAGEVRKMLVLVPSEVNTEGWVEQIQTYAPGLKYLQLIGAREQRHELVDKDADVYLLNYDGLMSYMTLFGEKGRKIHHRTAHEFAKYFDMVVFDESHLIGNKSSLRYRMCNVLSSEISYRYGMTGTPFGRNPEMLWSQFHLVDRGKTLGDTLGLFRAGFYHAKEDYFANVKYIFDNSKEKLLRQVIQNRSIRYEETEFSDMPKIKRQVHRLSFPVSTEEYYTRVLKELREAKGDVQATKNAFLRMRQVCSGFLSVRDEDGDKTEVDFYSNPKLEQLETILDGTGEEKIIVFHEFIRSGNMIQQMLERKKIKFARVGNKIKNPIEQMKRFMGKKDCRVLIFSHKSPAGAGLNLQSVCKRLVYYESPVSPIVRKQTERRITGGLRTGKHRVFIHDLVIAKSVDEIVLAFLKQGKDLFEAICGSKFNFEKESKWKRNSTPTAGPANTSKRLLTKNSKRPMFAGATHRPLFR